MITTFQLFTNYCIAQNCGWENFGGEFGECRAICQSFTYSNLYHKTADRLKISDAPIRDFTNVLITDYKLADADS